MPAVKGDSSVAVILVIIHRKKHIFKHGHKIEESNSYMKFGRNQVIID